MQPSEDDARELAKNSTLYKEFLAEREEICGIDPLLNSKFYSLLWLLMRGTYLQDFPRIAQGLKEKKPHGSESRQKGVLGKPGGRNPENNFEGSVHKTQFPPKK